ncbi:hypothetical protein FWG76_00910 [Candidatus Saccharibacteria bacterium]|nr:hypothetical protein [Candidatus Saccharibacteria bacterium]
MGKQMKTAMNKMDQILVGNLDRALILQIAHEVKANGVTTGYLKGLLDCSTTLGDFFTAVGDQRFRERFYQRSARLGQIVEAALGGQH